MLQTFVSMVEKETHVIIFKRSSNLQNKYFKYCFQYIVFDRKQMYRNFLTFFLLTFSTFKD